MADISQALRLSAQRALIGNVTQNLRYATVKNHGNLICIKLIYHDEASDEEISIGNEIISEIIADFPYHTLSDEVCKDGKEIYDLDIFEYGIVFLRRE